MERNISLHISQLLAQHDCVILPSFGAFIANNKPALVDLKRDYFTAPRREISYNRSLRQNDGLLAHQLAQSNSISYSEASRQLAELVKKIEFILEAEKEFTFPGIGVFYLHADKSLVFKSFENESIFPAAYGLSSFHYPKIHALNPPKGLSQGTRKVLKNSLLYIPLALALTIAPFQVQKHSEQLSSTFGLEPFFFASTESSEVISTSLSSTSAFVHPAHSQLEKAMLEVKSLKEQYQQQDNHRYFIIAASWPGEKGAQANQQKLISKGYKSRILKGENGRYRVSCASFKTMQEAENAIATYRKQIHPEAWIYVTR